MKKLYLLSLISFGFVHVLHAQATLTSAGIPPIGTVITNYEVDPPGVTPGSAGANQTWNFGSAIPTGLSTAVTVLHVDSTPFGSSFAGADFATESTDLQGNMAYSYFTGNASQLDMVGLGTIGVPNIILDYTDPRLVLPFPFTYNSTFTDSYAAYANFIISGVQVNQYRMGTQTVTADGWGTLTTPGGGPYNDVLRLKQEEFIVDSLTYTGFPGGMMFTEKIDSYSWTRDNALSRLFAIVYDSLDAGTTVSYTMGIYYSPLVTGVNEVNGGKPLAVYPNPVMHSPVIHLEVDELDPGMADFLVMDAMGREVKRLSFLVKPANRKSVSVEVSELPAGLYFVRVEQEETRLTAKFLKQ